MNNGAITLISPISTFKTLPSSNFCFSDILTIKYVMCQNITVFHLCHENFSCFLEVKLLLTQYAQLTQLLRVSNE